MYLLRFSQNQRGLCVKSWALTTLNPCRGVTTSTHPTAGTGRLFNAPQCKLRSHFSSFHWGQADFCSPSFISLFYGAGRKIITLASSSLAFKGPETREGAWRARWVGGGGGRGNRGRGCGRAQWSLKLKMWTKLPERRIECKRLCILTVPNALAVADYKSAVIYYFNFENCQWRKKGVNFEKYFIFVLHMFSYNIGGCE